MNLDTSRRRSLAAALTAALKDCPVPGPESLSIETLWVAFKNLRHYVQELANAARRVSLPIRVVRDPREGQWRILPAPAEISDQVDGLPLGANLELRTTRCDVCRRPLDFVGGRGAWHCTTVGCTRSIRRPAEIPTSRRSWRPAN